MAIFNFLKKKQEAEEKTDVKEEVQTTESQKSEKMFTELPEFPTMEEEDVNPFPKIEPLNELENSEINMPSLGETYFEKAALHPEKSIIHEFDEFNEEVEEQETEEENEVPMMLTKEDTKKKVSLPAKIKMPEREAFNPKKPVELADTINNLLINKNLQDKFINNNLAKAKQFSLGKMISETEKIYNL